MKPGKTREKPRFFSVERNMEGFKEEALPKVQLSPWGTKSHRL
jgi:hypothetical protein